jgi:outer membrane protein TolC
MRKRGRVEVERRAPWPRAPLARIIKRPQDRRTADVAHRFVSGVSPQPSHAPRIAGRWWKSVRRCPTLATGSSTQALAQNQTLVAASRALRAGAARQLANTRRRNANAGSRPLGGERVRASRFRSQSPGRPNYGDAELSRLCRTSLQLGPTIDYDTDLFGRIRREVEGAKASAEQSRDDLANARLVLTTDGRHRLFLAARTRRRDRRAEPAR